MENRYESKPGAPMFDHLFAFSSEKEAIAALPIWAPNGKWNRSITFPDVRIVLQRAVLEASPSELNKQLPKIARPRRELGGYRVLVAQTEPRLDIWETMPELEAIGDRTKADTSPEFYVRVRPASMPLFYLMEPVPLGSHYCDYDRRFLALSLVDDTTRYIDAVEHQKEIKELKALIEQTRAELKKESGNNAINIAALDDDLSLMLALLQARFVNANALERLMNTAVKTIVKLSATKIINLTIEAGASILLIKATELLAATWGN